ncbi:MAG TPA: YqeG family HAD IIIA-type phosphatase [Candidatus Onthocola stercoravium]|nr:YqeG family HAD IIIA-type phosphatase [Candidatus Onthocola stercoravium]
MDIFIPDVYQKSIYTINYKKLKKNGIKCLLFDLDNTIAPYKVTEPDVKVKELFARLEEDFKVIIISNSPKNRIRPFKEKLNVDCAYSSRKPFKTKYKKILEIYNFKIDEVACIGDQILTDILGANRMGFTSILVNRVAKYETIFTRFNRFFEGFILKNLAKKNILVSGEYYD